MTLDFESGVSILFDMLLKGLFLLSIMLMLDTILKRASASTRHNMWSVIMVSLFLLPVASITLTLLELPSLNLIPNAFGLFATPSLAINTPLPEDLDVTGLQGLDAPAIILIIYLTGLAAVLFWQLIGQIYSRIIKTRSVDIQDERIDNILKSAKQQMRYEGEVIIKRNASIPSPFSVGLIKPAIILPEGAQQWSSEIMSTVILHELGHIKRRDLWSRILSQLAVAVNWFNPMVWMGMRRQLVEQEIACDDMVLRYGSRPSEYAENLLIVANAMEGKKWSMAMAAMGRKSELKDRLLEILKPTRSKTPKGRMITFVTIFFLLLLIVPVLAVNVWQNEFSKVLAHSGDKADHTRQTEETMGNPAVKTSKENSTKNEEYEKQKYKEALTRKLEKMKQNGASEAEIKRALASMKKDMAKKFPEDHSSAPVKKIKKTELKSEYNSTPKEKEKKTLDGEKIKKEKQKSGETKKEVKKNQ